ncbi:uncharacterized protein N7496_000984 [Penicillium cataractarum]|uniref:Carrier domain-containing protein n=1 Tax=Penicillium cataractarum TaxID=2100454 RepID=A0A9X0B6I3_9EURO|nr:uncharacterized protein N7496_000984 [Penicillium cataractarum]KAJ5389916.1 hypothetical protein N7496_000984 [Penicillium cataractarum]
MLDCRAEAGPNRVWAKYPVSATSYTEGFQAATYSEMRTAVNRAAHLLCDALGESETFETLAYLGPNDLRYHIFLVAAIKTGYKMFFPSPRNSIVAQKELLARTECKTLLTPDPEPPMVTSLLRESPMNTIRIPSLEELFMNDASLVPYPYIHGQKSLDVVRDQPVLVLHTSGSTGQRIAGIGWGFVLPLFKDSIPVLPLPGRPPSTDGFLEAVRYGHFAWAFVLPIIIDELTSSPEARVLVSEKLKYLFYTGGALPPSAGERAVAAGIQVYSGLGSSECGALPQVRSVDDHLHPPSETWRYLHFNPAMLAEFRHRMDDLHELVVRRSSTHADAQPVFALFPDLEEFETHDLFSPHPDLPDLWMHRGRRDDLIVLLNGEKTNPISFEAEITAHPDVRGALVAGNKRIEACLIVEPVPEALQQATDDTPAKDYFINKIWPTVEESNHHCPAHARIARSMILILDPDMPMLRAGKGTIQRAGTLQLYAEHIEALYIEKELPTPPAIPLSRESVTSTLRSIVADITGWSELQDDVDFFDQGMDSLQLLRLSPAIRSRLGVSISPSVIYSNPSVALLITKICQDTMADTEQDQTILIQEILQQYKQQIDHLASEPTKASPEPNRPATKTVILTGSTGTVGSFVLGQLLNDPEVAHIYCLNRSTDSESLQITRNLKRGIHTPLDADRVTFLTVDLTGSSYGLDTSALETLVGETTQIIHSAWPVDFNQPLSFFQPSLQALVNLITFASQAKHNPPLLFLSSISAVSSATGLIPEETLPDLTSPAPMGYGQSKYLAERILAHAATALPHLRLGVARIGQVSGRARGPEGAWARTDWLPSLVVSSRYLGALPDSLGGGRMEAIDWVPVDDLAVILVELSEALSTGSGALSVFHCVNPEAITWQDLVPATVEELSTPEKNLVTVTFEEWLERLQNSAAELDRDEVKLDEFFAHNPAVKLLDFYQQLLVDSGDKGNGGRLALDKSVCVSQALSGLRPVQPEWMHRWIGEWVDN